MKKTLQLAYKTSLPVMAGYIVLGTICYMLLIRYL